MDAVLSRDELKTQVEQAIMCRLWLKTFIQNILKQVANESIDVKAKEVKHKTVLVAKLVQTKCTNNSVGLCIVKNN